jgi:hypothetical protein
MAAQPDPIGKKRTDWGKIFGGDICGSSFASASAACLGADLGGSSSLHRRSSASATSGASLNFLST